MNIAGEGKFFGKYRGTVVKNVSAAGPGWLVVDVPSILGLLNIPASPCVPYAGVGVGMLFIPPPGASVWIEFEGGNTDSAIWSGCFWAKAADAPKFDGKPAGPGVHILKTEKTQMMISKDEGIKIKVDSGMEASLSQGTITVKSGKSTVTITSSSIDIESSSGNVKIDSKQLTAKGASAIEMKAGDVKIEGTLDVNSGNLKVS